MALTAAHTLQVKKWVVGGGQSPRPFIGIAFSFINLANSSLQSFPSSSTSAASRDSQPSKSIPFRIPHNTKPNSSLRHLSKMTNFLLMFRQHPFYIFRLLFLMAIGGSLLLNQNCGFASAAVSLGSILKFERIQILKNYIREKFRELIRLSFKGSDLEDDF